MWKKNNLKASWKIKYQNNINEIKIKIEIFQGTDVKF